MELAMLPTPEPRGEPLSHDEATLLTKLVAEHGDVWVSQTAGVARATVSRGANGLRLYRRQREALRGFLFQFSAAA
jgi:hypothetical protein